MLSVGKRHYVINLLGLLGLLGIGVGGIAVWKATWASPEQVSGVFSVRLISEDMNKLVAGTDNVHEVVFALDNSTLHPVRVVGFPPG